MYSLAAQKNEFLFQSMSLTGKITLSIIFCMAKQRSKGLICAGHNSLSFQLVNFFKKCLSNKKVTYCTFTENFDKCVT